MVFCSLYHGITKSSVSLPSWLPPSCTSHYLSRCISGKDTGQLYLSQGQWKHESFPRLQFVFSSAGQITWVVYRMVKYTCSPICLILSHNQHISLLYTQEINSVCSVTCSICSCGLNQSVNCMVHDQQDFSIIATFCLNFPKTQH